MQVFDIRTQLERDEGVVLTEYKDHLGYSTIGIGRLIDKRKGGGISRDEAYFLLDNDLLRIRRELQNKLPWIRDLDVSRQGVLLNMAYQMGVEGLLKFNGTLAHIQKGNYAEAGTNMMQSLWAKQTPARAKRLERQMVLGAWQ